MAGPPRTLWRKASPRKATDESLLAACLPRHRPFAYPVCVVAQKPRFRPGNPPRHVRIGTSVCVVASGDDPSSSTAVRRTGHCQKDYLQQKDYRKDSHRMRLKASTRISWTRNRCCDQFDGHKMRSDNTLHIPWPSLLRKLPPSFEPYLKNLWPYELHKGTNF